MNQQSRPENKELERALALLISATKKKKRAVPLTKIADALSVAQNKLGSIAQVAAAIGLSGKMLGQFARVKDLHPVVQEMIESRSIDSVDAVVHLAQLDKPSQVVAANGMAEGRLDTKDLRAVLELYKTESARRPISEIIDRVRASRTKREYVIEFVVRGTFEEAEVRKRLSRYLAGDNIIEVSAEGSLGRIVLNEEGYRQLREHAQHVGAGLKELATLATTQQD